jgi:Lrp/AsnC family leucine-responsive transcriptional regulator
MTAEERGKIVQKIALDAADCRLLAALQADGRASGVELAERVRLSASQCQRRLKRLEEAGLVTGYGVRLDRRKLGLDVVAFVQVSLARHGDDPAEGFHAAVAAMPEILEVHAITGDADYILRVVAPDLEAFSDVVLKRLLALPMVAAVRSSLSLGEIKATDALPLPA